MKLLCQILCVCLFTLSLNSQPKTPNITTTTKTSISVNTTSNNLRFNAKWSNSSNYTKLKTFLLERLGKDGLTVNGDVYKWSKEDDVFSCRLGNKSLKMSLDRDEASKALADQVDDLMDNLPYAMGNTKPEDYVERARKKLEKAEKKIEKAQKEFESAKQELEKAQRKLKQATDSLKKKSN